MLPDLTRVVVLVPDTGIAPALRRALLQHAQKFAALLGPEITTLQRWVMQSGAGQQSVPGEQARELMFVESIREYTHLFGNEDPWRLAESLLTLFDELTLHRIALPEKPGAFTDSLQKAYGATGQPLEGLSREAQIIHTLWHAWHQQLDSEQLLEPAAAYIQNLQHCLRSAGNDRFILLLGHHDLSGAERQWFSGMAERQTITWITHQSSLPQLIWPEQVAALRSASPMRSPQRAEDPVSTFLDAVYAGPTPDLATRVGALTETVPSSPATGRLEILEAENAEAEAQAVDLQVRRWLIDHPDARIGIVTGDRRLARRIRALLERAGIALEDNGGWALSTTSAAAAVERWLETVEENFAWKPLLDVLKSPFVFPDQASDSRLALVYRLEQDVILHENIARGLDRYRRHIDYRTRRLAWPSAEIPEQLHALLNRLEEAAQPLLESIRGRHAARLFLARLRDSMERLGLWSTLENDPAGQRVLQVWEDLDAASRYYPLQLDWFEFRGWLGRTLERDNFRPGRRPAQVQLLSLAQSRLHRFDALMVAACDRAHLPGPVQHSPWFNNDVRRELGLPGHEEILASRLHDFRCLLESAPRVLFTWHREESGEPLLCSPWLELLQNVHEYAYDSSLAAQELQQLLNQPGTQVASEFPLALPGMITQPRPRAAQELRPTVISASAYQQLVDCPYQFYAARCLGLQAPDAVREALQKSDYGERVHRCLEAFHGNVEFLPGPFGERITETNRDAAVALLENISHKVFAKDLEDNFEHRGWLKRWFARIPEYIDWEIRRQRQWKVKAVEVTGEKQLDDNLDLKGRLDRVDEAEKTAGIVDYKTGYAPRQHEVENGEAVQLAVYAALAGGDSSRAEYLLLDQTPVKGGAALEGDTLKTLRELNLARLENIISAIDDGAALPAWGDEKTCSYCSMDGVCRKQAWPLE